MSAAEPCRRMTAWKPSSAQAIGESSVACCIAGGMTKRGTMMPPMAAARRLPTPPITVACSMVRAQTATRSAQPIAAKLVQAATTASRSQRAGRASASPPSHGTSVMPAASMSTVCTRLTAKNGAILPARTSANGTRWLARRARVPSRRSTMNSADIGITTKNMPKISQAGTFCCTEDGRPPRGLPMTSMLTVGARLTPSAAPITRCWKAMSCIGGSAGSARTVRVGDAASPDTTSTKPSAPLRKLSRAAPSLSGAGATWKPSPARLSAMESATLGPAPASTAKSVRRAPSSLKASLSASDMMTRNAAGMRNSTAKPCTSRDSTSHSLSHRARRARILSGSLIAQRALRELHEDLFEVALTVGDGKRLAACCTDFCERFTHRAGLRHAQPVTRPAVVLQRIALAPRGGQAWRQRRPEAKRQQSGAVAQDVSEQARHEHAAMVEDRHAVAERLHFFHVVAGVDHDAPRPGKRADGVEEEGARLRVDP